MQPMLHTSHVAGCPLKKDRAFVVSWDMRPLRQREANAQGRWGSPAIRHCRHLIALLERAAFFTTGCEGETDKNYGFFNEKLSAGFLKRNKNNRKKCNSMNCWGTPVGTADWAQRIRSLPWRGQSCPSFDTKCQSAAGSLFLPYSNFGFQSNVYYSRKTGALR